MARQFSMSLLTPVRDGVGLPHYVACRRWRQLGARRVGSDGALGDEAQDPAATGFGEDPGKRGVDDRVVGAVPHQGTAGIEPLDDEVGQMGEQRLKVL